jgi:hypothetical protein
MLNFYANFYPRTCLQVPDTWNYIYKYSRLAKNSVELAPQKEYEKTMRGVSLLHAIAAQFERQGPQRVLYKIFQKSKLNSNFSLQAFVSKIKEALNKPTICRDKDYTCKADLLIQPNGLVHLEELLNKDKLQLDFEKSACSP